jgi:hypothetical protein
MVADLTLADRLRSASDELTELLRLVADEGPSDPPLIADPHSLLTARWSESAVHRVSATVVDVIVGPDTWAVFLSVCGWVDAVSCSVDVVVRAACCDGQLTALSVCSTDDDLLEQMLGVDGPSTVMARRSPVASPRAAAVVATMLLTLAGVGIDELGVTEPVAAASPLSAAASASDAVVAATSAPATTASQPTNVVPATQVTAVASPVNLAASASNPAPPPESSQFAASTNGTSKSVRTSGPSEPRRVISGEGADPSMLTLPTGVYVYSTNADLRNIPVTNVSSGRTTDALPKLPEWSERGDAWGRVWAPSVIAVGDQYVMWYTTLDAQSGLQCISVATSDSPMGPFVDSSTGPAICPVADGGAIDPDVFVDIDGRIYLHYKTDGNCCGLTTRIEAVELAADATEVISKPKVLLSAKSKRTRDLIEGPSMANKDGRYVLLVSHGDWANETYRTDRAVCESAVGPCRIEAKNVLGRQGIGAGGASFVDSTADAAIVFHAWQPDKPSHADGGVRQTWALDSSAVLGKSKSART